MQADGRGEPLGAFPWKAFKFHEILHLPSEICLAPSLEDTRGVVAVRILNFAWCKLQVKVTEAQVVVMQALCSPLILRYLCFPYIIMLMSKVHL